MRRSTSRFLLTHWAWHAYKKLEALREAAEAKGEKSLFYRAFERSGCLVTANGEGDETIDVVSTIKKEVESFRLMSVAEAENFEQFVIQLHDDSDSENSDGEDTADEEEFAEEEKAEEKEDDVVMDGELVNDEGKVDEEAIQQAIIKEGVGGLRDWSRGADAPVAPAFVPDEFLDSVFLGLDSVADKEGDAKEKALLNAMLAQFRDENPGKKWPSNKQYENMKASAHQQSMEGADKQTRSSRRRRVSGGMVQ